MRLRVNRKISDNRPLVASWSVDKHNASILAYLYCSGISIFRSGSVNRTSTMAIRWDNAWLFSANYYYQRYYRSQLDQRINADGARVHSHNHVLSGKADYRLSNGLTLSATAEYQRHAYLDEIPVLYTKLTSDWFNNSAVFFTVNINYCVSL